MRQRSIVGVLEKKGLRRRHFSICMVGFIWWLYSMDMHSDWSFVIPLKYSRFDLDIIRKRAETQVFWYLFCLSLTDQPTLQDPDDHVRI